MGVSTNGLLWYGAAFDGSHEDGDEPATTIDLFIYGDEDSDEEEPYGDGREWMAEHGITGIEFVEHCSGGYRMWGIALEGSLTTARRGSPQQITAFEAPDATPVVAALLALGLNPDDYPLGWYLASMWD